MELVTFLFMIAIIPVVYSCDPVTQFEKDGKCCKKCGPGTRMKENQSSCLDPICNDCLNNEYQPGYTENIKCTLQPWCDQNKNFEATAKNDKIILNLCICKEGHHCSTEACLTCVPHSQCGPGWEMRSRGNHTHDTVCRPCPGHSFSSGSSAESVCKPWTECMSGLIKEVSGTATSDVVCVPETISSGAVTGIVIVIIILLVLAIFLICRFKGRPGDGCHKAMESSMNGLRNCFPRQQVKKVNLEEKLKENQPMIPAEVPLPQCPCPQTPVEDDVNDSHAESYPMPQDMTENGHVVAQEEGKAHHTSVCDSQMSVVISL